MMRRALLAGVVLLYVVSIPWYRSADAPVSVWLGLPDWVAVALGCYVAAAVLNAWAWSRADVRDEEPGAAHGAGSVVEAPTRDAASHDGTRPPGAAP